MENPLLYLTDPVLRAPTIATVLMCFTSALVGVLVVLRRQALIGEALSHAVYPGILLGALLVGDPLQEGLFALGVLGGAFLFGWLALLVIHRLEGMKVRPDAALCAVLSAFFGWGIVFASHMQFSEPLLYQQAHLYLFGQAATLLDFHIVLYGLLGLIVLGILLLWYREIELVLFDRAFAQSVGVSPKRVDRLLLGLVILAVVVGIRSVGVVLMSAMLVAPAVTARQVVSSLKGMLGVAACVGALGGFMGCYTSVELARGWEERMVLPTGPMVVLVAAAICFGTLLFAPPRGLVFRFGRKMRFRLQCLSENLLKSLWKKGKPVPFTVLKNGQGISGLFLSFLLWRLIRAGWVARQSDGTFQLTEGGGWKAARIVRLHRLWELYLVNCLGTGAERVHRSAEEMEHIITPEIEETLVTLLDHPTEDPHHQPIPPPTKWRAG